MGDVPFISTALRGNNMTAKQTAPLVILNSTCKSAQCVRMCVFWGGGGVLVCFNRLFCTTTANCGKYEPHRWLTVYDECSPLEQHTHTHTHAVNTPHLDYSHTVTGACSYFPLQGQAGFVEARSAASLSQLEAVSIKSEVPTEPSRSHRHLFDVSIPAAEPVRGDEEASCFLTAIVTAIQDTQ